MGKVLVVVLGLAAILAAAQYALKSTAAPQAAEPARRLQNVRNAATRIETGAQERADEALRRSATTDPASALQTE